MKKSKRRSLFSAIEELALMHFGMFNLSKGRVEKVFIETMDAHYIINNRGVTCMIKTYLKVRYTSGKSEIIDSYEAKGISKCAPDDRFNILTGIKLATARAENNYNAYYSKLIDKYFDSISTFASRLDCLRDNCISQLMHNNEHFIPSLIDKENK